MRFDQHQKNSLFQPPTLKQQLMMGQSVTVIAKVYVKELLGSGYRTWVNRARCYQGSIGSNPTGYWAYFSFLYFFSLSPSLNRFLKIAQARGQNWDLLFNFSLN